jgi:peptidoglycan/xylan/chitin deacetylase (PgdA/CDA1 family)
MYHSINEFPKDNPLGFLSQRISELIAHLRFFQNAGFEFITLPELIQKTLASDFGKKKFIVLTFDDGFLDNYLLVANILQQFKARGTIFVNPGHATNDPPRTLLDYPNAWGYLNFAEMQELEKGGIFDIQSHSMTHDYIFISNQLVDLYSPDKFDKYYWLTWMLYPFTKTEWHGDITRFAGLVPSGYPIFMRGRCLDKAQFIPSAEFVNLCISQYASKSIDCISDLKMHPEIGQFEAEQDYLARVGQQLRDSKVVLESKLSKTVEHICFPGNIFNQQVLSLAAEVGYKVFIQAGKQTPGYNFNALQNASKTLSQNRMIGLKRVSLKNEFPGIVPAKTAANWTAKIRIYNLLDHPFYSGANSVSRLVKRIIRGKKRIIPW